MRRSESQCGGRDHRLRGHGATDHKYPKAAAVILESAREVFASSDMMTKLKESQPTIGRSFERTRSSLCISSSGAAPRAR